MKTDKLLIGFIMIGLLLGLSICFTDVKEEVNKVPVAPLLSECNINTGC